MNQQPLNDAQRILALTDLQASDGWRIILERIDHEVAKIEKALIESAEPSEVEALRAEREHWLTLRDLPGVQVENMRKLVEGGYKAGY